MVGTCSPHRPQAVPAPWLAVVSPTSLQQCLLRGKVVERNIPSKPLGSVIKMLLRMLQPSLLLPKNTPACTLPANRGSGPAAQPCTRCVLWAAGGEAVQMGPVAGGAEPPAWATCIAATRGAASVWMEPPCSLLPFTPRFFPLPSTVHSWAEELCAEVGSTALVSLRDAICTQRESVTQHSLSCSGRVTH